MLSGVVKGLQDILTILIDIKKLLVNIDKTLTNEFWLKK